MFEHTSKEIYDLATKDRVSKLVHSPKRSYNPGLGEKMDDERQRPSKTNLMDQAKVFDKNNGGNSHVETVNMMASWHKFGFHLLMRNRSNYFKQIETGHFMSRGIIPKVPGNFVLHELTNTWLKLYCIEKVVPISSIMKLEWVNNIGGVNKLP